MSFEIRFTPEAEETYTAIVSQLSQRWGKKFVSKFEAKVLKCLNTIQQTPFIYPVIEENVDIRKCILHKNCSMIYKNRINIICFWDNRQDPLIIT